MKKFHFFSSTLVLALILRGAVLQSVCGPCECQTDRIYGGVKVVCSGLKLTSVPTSLPSNTTSLLMDRNDLEDLQRGMFAKMDQLRSLDLSHNDLYKLDEQVFIGLRQLVELKLDHSRIYLQGANSGVSLKLSIWIHTLTWIGLFNISYSCYYCSYRLQSLYIPCDHCKFDSSFLKLKRLSLLSIASSICKLSLDMYTFQYMPYLEILNLTGCRVSVVHPGYLDPLKNLQMLDISVNNVRSSSTVLVEATKSLMFSPIKYIRFASYWANEINNDVFSYLQNTSLRQLHIIYKGRNIPLIHKESIEKLPISLEVLTLNHVSVNQFGSFDHLQQTPNLTTLDLSYINIPLSLRILLTQSLERLICVNCLIIGIDNSYRDDMRRPNMKQLILPDYNRKTIDPFLFQSLPNVEHIDLKNNALTSLPTFPPNNLITYLNFASNRLGNLFAENNTLESLSHLKVIDISDNNIVDLAEDVFIHLHSLKAINLRNNDMRIVNVRLFHSTDLEVLDLRNNRLSTIGEATRNDITRLPKIKLHLDGNPLVCGCDELDSLLWMKQNIERIHNLNSLKCRSSTDEYESLDNLDEIITHLQTRCNPKYPDSDAHVVEISVSVCVTICVLTTILVVLGYRHRWKLRYLYFSGRRGYRRRYNKEQVDQEEYDFDAFVSYASPDRIFVIDEMKKELEDKHGLKLCIHHRDFLPGEVISDNIINAIQNSRKTVVVLSPAFLESTWCEFEFNMARMEGVSRRQDIVLMVLYEDVPMMNLSKDMAMMLKHNSYMEYNHELFSREMFWFIIKESIQIVRPRD